MPPRRSSPLLLLLLPLGSGCGMDLPLSERIVNIRPLGVRVEAQSLFAPEPSDRAARAEALPVADTIVLEPLLVDDQGTLSPERIETELEPMWLACPLQPIQGIFSCLSSRLPLEPGQIEDCPTLDLDGLELDGPPSIPSPCRLTGGTPAAPSMQVPLDFNLFLGGDLEITMIAHRPGVRDTEQCAEALLQEQPLSGDCLYSVQRAAVGPDSEIARFAVEYGLADDASLGAQPDPAPDPDRHPRIQSFRVVVTDQTGLRGKELPEAIAAGEPIDVARDDTVMIAAGQTLVIETTAPEQDRQFLPLPLSSDEEKDDPTKDEDCCARWRELTGKETEPCPESTAPYPDAASEDEVIVLSFGRDFACKVENYDGEWYRTWGTLLSGSSDDTVSYNTWAMVPGEQDDPLVDTPPEGRATLYYVLRDGRAGVDWFWFHVMVQ